MTFLQAVEEKSVGQHLDFLAKQNGLVAVAVDENSFWLMTPEKAREIQASSGLPVVPSEEAWESSAMITLPAGSTVRQGLDAFKAEGYRWAISAGKVFIFK